MEKIVEKMCHAPAECFRIDRRGYLEEGNWADIAIVDPKKEWTVDKHNIHFKCGWSPFEGHTFKGMVTETLVSGHLAYQNGSFNEEGQGKRIEFV